MQGTPFTDLCTACDAVQHAAKADAIRRERQPLADAHNRAVAALEDLVAMGSPRLVARRRTMAPKRTIFGRQEQYADEAPAWPIGRLSTDISEGHSHGAYSTKIECGVTADGSVVTMDPWQEGTPKINEVRKSVFAINTFWPVEELQQIASRLESIRDQNQ